jgi:hypothetical protein
MADNDGLLRFFFNEEIVAPSAQCEIGIIFRFWFFQGLYQLQRAL